MFLNPGEWAFGLHFTSTVDRLKGSESGFVTRLRLCAVVLAVGAGSSFMCALDSVMDNVQPLARDFLQREYIDKGDDGHGVARTNGTHFSSNAPPPPLPTSESVTISADDLWGKIVAARLYGVALGCCAVPLIAVRVRRRKNLLLAVLGLTLFGGVLTVLVRLGRPWGYWLAMSGRFLTGFGSGVGQVLGAALLAEIPPTAIRGAVLSTQTFFACLGELFGLWISLDWMLGRPECWHWALFAPTAVIPVALAILAFAPDSPRALMIAGEQRRALEALHFYQTTDQWVDTLREIRAELRLLPGASRSASGGKLSIVSIVPLTENEKTKTTKRGQWPMIWTRAFILPVILATIVQSFVHLDDWLWISYSTDVFERYAKMGHQTACKASFWIVVPQVVVSLVLVPYFDRFPRRIFLIAPTLFSVVNAAFVGLMISNFPSWFASWMPLLPILASMDLCASAVASESAYTVVPELFSQHDRLFGTAFAGISQNLIGAVLTMAIPAVIDGLGLPAVIYPLACLNLIYVAVIYFALPETCGLPFNEIAAMFSSADSCSFMGGVRAAATEAHARLRFLWSRRQRMELAALTIVCFFLLLLFGLIASFLVFSKREKIYLLNTMEQTTFTSLLLA